MRFSPPPPPSRVTIKRTTVERMELYRHVSLPGRPIPVEVTPLPAEDSIPRKVDIAEVVKRLRPKRLGVPLGMRAEHLLQWLHEAMR